MGKFNEVDLEMAFNAGRIYESGKVIESDEVNEAFNNWFDAYTEDECK